MPTPMTGKIYYGSTLLSEPCSGGSPDPFSTVDATDTPNTAASRGAVLTRPASNNTPSDWTTLVASAADSAGAFTLTVSTPLPFPASFGQRVSALFDVAYGTGNTIVASGLLAAGYAGQWSIATITLPCSIPAGEPVKVRYQVSDEAPDIDWYATIHLLGPAAVAGETVTMGENTADSGGTEIDPGGSANTKGSWVQLEASTPDDFSELFLLVATEDTGTRSSDDVRWLVDIGTGPETSETVLVSNISIASGLPNPAVTRIPVGVAAGTRLSVRAQCNSTDPEDRVFDAVLIGAVATSTPPAAPPDPSWAALTGVSGSWVGIGLPNMTVINTKSDWGEMVASTASDAEGFMLTLHSPNSGGNVDVLVDVGIGAEDAEVPIVSNLLWGGIPTSPRPLTTFFPIPIPAGSRIAMRQQATSISQPALTRATIHLLSGGAPSTFTQVVTMGANTADSGGTSVDPGAVVDTKGDWTEIVAATSAALRQLLVCIGNQTNTVRVEYGWLVDIAVGGDGSETVIIPDLPVYASNVDDIIGPKCFPSMPVDIPAGSRIAVRAQCNGDDPTDRLFDIALYGFG